MVVAWKLVCSREVGSFARRLLRGGGGLDEGGGSGGGGWVFDFGNS